MHPQSSPAKRRGLIEASTLWPKAVACLLSSPAKRRGLIEAYAIPRLTLITLRSSSPAKRRGLIEAEIRRTPPAANRRHPRLNAGASLKRLNRGLLSQKETKSSPAKRRGLIEATS